MASKLPLEEFFQRIHPDDEPRIRQAHQQLTQGACDSYSGEFRFADAQGQYHWLLSRGRVLEQHPESGLASLAAGTHVDIAEIKRIEGELRQAMLDAQVANQAKSRFISSMSHELRTPLNAIQGFAQLMQMQARAKGQEQEQGDFLMEILRASRHLNHLVGDILEWSGTQLQSVPLELGLVDVGELMRESAELVRAEMNERGLRLNLDLPEAKLQVWAEPRRLRQVLLNLLSNAIKYNKPDGQVTLSYQVAAGQLRLLVEDTGLGIASDLQHKVFEPFQRLGRENSMIQGTGIGLSLCRELASLMHGRMGLHSEEGIGSSFWIELALYDSKPSTAPAKPPRSQPRIVYAEDNPASQFLVRAVLNDIAEVEVASNGVAALQLIAAAPPDLVLLDLKLPGMDGEELLARLRSDPKLQGLPVVILSAVSGAEVLRSAALDCQGLLSKPLDMQELRSLVEALLAEELKHAD